MRLPIFTTFVVFIIILNIKLALNNKKDNNTEKEFWEREQKANFVRKKDISNLPYVNFDPNALPLHHEIEDPNVQEYIRELEELSSKKILNCTGKSNTDLKLEYGTANITCLTEYDQNYTVLVRALAKLSEKYMEQNLVDDAIALLEYSVSIESDIKRVYELLGDYYASKNDYAAISRLKINAELLNSLSKNPILRYLDDLIPG